MKWIYLIALPIFGWCAATAQAADAGAPGLTPIPIFTDNMRILFQGDSITHGGRGGDPNHYLGHGFVFIIAAKYGEAYASRKLDFMNRGISGNSVLDLEKRWKTDTLALKPGILSILIGVNDNSKNIPFDQYEQTYDKIISDAKAANPKLKLVLCEPFTLPVGAKKTGYEAWSAGIKKRQEIVAALAKKHGAALVRFQQAFDEACKRAPAEHWIWDGVHPTYSGHQIMADEWVKTVSQFFAK